jgi:hypothetical protein
MSVCSLRYEACSANAPFCRLWPNRLYSISPHYLMNGKIFLKVTVHKMCVSIFYTNLSETLLILRRNERDKIKKIDIDLHAKCRLFLSDFNES